MPSYWPRTCQYLAWFQDYICDNIFVKSVGETYFAIYIYIYIYTHTHTHTHCLHKHSGVPVSCTTIFSLCYQCGVVLVLDLRCFPPIAQLQGTAHLGLITTSFFGFVAAISKLWNSVEEMSLLPVHFRSLYFFILLPKVHGTNSWCNLFILTGKQLLNGHLFLNTSRLACLRT